MKKILFIVTQSEWGGAQRYIFDLATNLDKSKYQVEVAAGQGTGELFERLEKDNIKTYKIPHLRREISPLNDFLAYREIKNIINKSKPNILHLNSSKAEVLGALAGNKCNIDKIIYTAHGFVFNEPMSKIKKLFYKKIEKFISKKINTIIAVSDFDRKSAIQSGFDPIKLVKIHNGISISNLNFLNKQEARQILFSTQNNNLQIDESLPFLGTIANFYYTKGLDILIKAVAKTKANIFIIGDGIERENLEKLIKSHKLENRVFLTGYLENASQYLKAFDLYVMPSRKEGLPYVLLEAGVAKVPIVATNVGGVVEIVHNNINGYLIEPMKPDKLATKIKQAIDKPLDFQLDNDFSLNKMLKETTQVYNQ